MHFNLIFPLYCHKILGQNLFRSSKLLFVCMEMHIDVTQHNMYTLTHAVVVSLLAIPLWLSIFTYTLVSVQNLNFRLHSNLSKQFDATYSKMNYNLKKKCVCMHGKFYLNPTSYDCAVSKAHMAYGTLFLDNFTGRGKKSGKIKQD